MSWPMAHKKCLGRQLYAHFVTQAQAMWISSEACASKTDCMSNAVILRTICSYLSMSDLKNCRLVSKVWQSESNSAMHRYNIAIKISWDFLLSHVKKLNVLVPNMSLPFKRLSFGRSRYWKNEEDSGNATLQKFLEILPPIKHLEFNDSSASEELILRIMESNANHLEILSIYNTDRNVPTEIPGAIFQLRKLKKMCITTYSSERGDRGDLKAIIENCETLRSVEGIAFRDLTDVSENRWYVIKHFNVFIDAEPFDWRPLEKYLQVVEAHRRFNTLTIQCRHWHSSHEEKKMLINFVKSCKDTLTSLRLALGTLQFQSIYDLCEGLKLRCLILDGFAQSHEDVDSELLGMFPEEVRLLKNMNIGNAVAHLRKLQIVPVRPTLHHLKGLVELTISVFSQRTRWFNLVHWDKKTHGISYSRDRDMSKLVKALSLEKMRSLWSEGSRASFGSK